MRLAVLIVGVAAICVALVHLRREEIAVRHDIQTLESARVPLRRELWRTQIKLSHKLRPDEVRRRAEELALGLDDARPAPLTRRRDESLAAGR
jgi:hypothetical protein